MAEARLFILKDVISLSRVRKYAFFQMYKRFTTVVYNAYEGFELFCDNVYIMEIYILMATGVTEKICVLSKAFCIEASLLVLLTRCGQSSYEV